MNILLVNNFYYYRGGDCTYLFSLKRLLERKGHKVSIFSMNHPLNHDTKYSKYFVGYINYAEEVKDKNLSSMMKVFTKSIYSLEAKQNIIKLINDEKPDIVHLNNIRHHVTPSVIYTIKKHNIPLVWTLHDYQLICPNISFISHGKVCERCRKRKYFWPLIMKCKKNSYLASSMAAIEHSFQMITGVYDLVDAFICPSRFLRDKFIEYGFKENKMYYLNHFIDSEYSAPVRKDEDYYLYVGRLSEEKGVKALIDAAVKLKSYKLKIIGDGPIRDELILYAKSKKADYYIEFLGHKSHEEVLEHLRECKFLVVPSEWYEVMGLVILEAFICGKPVIGSRIGGIPEIVTDGKTGLTFEPGNSDDLRDKIEYMYTNPQEAVKMGDNAVSFVKQELGPEKHYNLLMEIYNKALTNKETE